MPRAAGAKLIANGQQHPLAALPGPARAAFITLAGRPSAGFGAARCLAAGTQACLYLLPGRASLLHARLGRHPSPACPGRQQQRAA
jgi:hypothetical protein